MGEPGDDTSEQEASKRIDRRDAIRKAVVGGAVAGVVWSAPKVEGLSLRPNYAAAGTGGGGCTSGSITIAGTANTPSVNTRNVPGVGTMNISGWFTSAGMSIFFATGGFIASAVGTSANVNGLCTSTFTAQFNSPSNWSVVGSCPTPSVTLNISCT